MTHMSRFGILLSFATILAACGGGGDGGTAGGGTNQFLTPGTHKLTFSAISTARLDAPISAIDVAVKFPAGISVSTPTGGTGQITDASITPGSAMLTTSLTFGNYSASTRTAYLSMATTQETLRGGQFVNLLFTVAPGTSIMPEDIYALNATYPKYTVVGIDTVTHSSVTMTGSVKTTLSVTP